MIKVGVIGASGYSGSTLLKLLIQHKDVCVNYISANNTVGPLSDIYPEFKGKLNLNCEKFNVNKAIAKCELLFLAVPHTVAMQITPKLLERNRKVIDLSGDYRLNSAAQYKEWYKTTHIDLSNLKSSVYGLPELYREDIKKAKLIANPGCYPTAAILGLAPIVSTHSKTIDSITIDAKSGTSGAGRKATLALSFSETNENFKAYKALDHQHAPEIDLYLSKIGGKLDPIDFVPHLLPINRGILETIYVRLTEKTTLTQIHNIYKKFYKLEKFVRLLNPGEQPEIKNVAYSNYCDIGLTLSANKKLLVVTSVIDNLMKGAASQAIQNMNIMYGFKESEAIQ